MTVGALRGDHASVIQARVRHAKWLEDALSKETVICLSGALLDDDAEQEIAGVAVSVFGTGSEIERRVCHQSKQFLARHILANIKPKLRSRVFRNSRCVVEELPDRDSAPGRRHAVEYDGE